MPIKMLTSLAGADFSVAPGDTPSFFSAKEEAKLVAAGLAEKLPDEGPDDEQARLQADLVGKVAELTRLEGENNTLSGRVSDLENALSAKDAEIARLTSELAAAVANAAKPAAPEGEPDQLPLEGEAQSKGKGK